MMVASIVLLIGLGEISVKGPPQRSLRLFEEVTALAVVCVTGGFVLRGKYVTKGAPQLAKNPTDALALKHWQTGHMIGFVASEAVALYGLNLRFAGFTLVEVAPFYLDGFGLMLFWRPRTQRREPA